MKKRIETIARAIIVREKKILICRARNRGHAFFPGGHIEFGESAQGALARELKEEAGVTISAIHFIGVVENVFNQHGTRHHEINIVFSAKTPNRSIISREPRITFEWLPVSKLPTGAILPVALSRAVYAWRQHQTPFFNGLRLTLLN